MALKRIISFHSAEQAALRHCTATFTNWHPSTIPTWKQVCVNPVNILDPIQISSGALARSRSDSSCTPVCFRTRSFWPKPDSQPEPNWFQAGFAQYRRKLPSGRKLPSLKVENWLWAQTSWNQAWQFLHTGLLPDQMHLAKTWPGHPTGPDQMQEVRSGIHDLAQFWLHAGQDHNQNASQMDPARLLGTSFLNHEFLESQPYLKMKLFHI